MDYKVTTGSIFRREASRLMKKYPSLDSELRHLAGQLSKDPRLGVALGNDCYKIRLAIASKGKGKSGGARVITYVRIIETTVYMISIFDKSEQESISDKELEKILKEIP